ncbi:MAG TPA: S-methyl-5'-thioadenosine phosphorylase [Planctomycetota bacterium]|nr:S-methyl-5'-thioadenosine phosphorylase [Planctomycetota bacterium]
MTERTLGVIGGSGLYDLPGLQDAEEVQVSTPFGAPSDALIVGRLHGVKMAFLPRHGRGHRLAPHELPFRANMHAMKQLGMEAVVGISAVGSMKEHIAPGDLVIVDQFIDRTRGRTRESTFFGDGCVAHCHFADPVWEPLRQIVLQAARQSGAKVHDRGTYLCMEGPHFSTRAESKLYRSWGVDVIGMTNLQEAKLAREAEIAYATVALATDYDCWHEVEGDVDVQAILRVLQQNVARAKQVVDHCARLIAAAPAQPSAKGEMANAILTAKDRVTADARRRLELLVREYLG